MLQPSIESLTKAIIELKAVRERMEQKDPRLLAKIEILPIAFALQEWSKVHPEDEYHGNAPVNRDFIHIYPTSERGRRMRPRDLFALIWVIRQTFAKRHTREEIQREAIRRYYPELDPTAAMRAIKRNEELKRAYDEA